MKKLRIPSAKSATQPATRGMLALVRDELKADILSIRSKLESHDHRFESLERRFDSVDARFNDLRSEMRAGFDEIRAELVRVATLVEEQNANNRIVSRVTSCSGKGRNASSPNPGTRKTASFDLPLRSLSE